MCCISHFELAAVNCGPHRKGKENALKILEPPMDRLLHPTKGTSVVEVPVSLSSCHPLAAASIRSVLDRMRSKQ